MFGYGFDGEREIARVVGSGQLVVVGDHGQSNGSNGDGEQFGGLFHRSVVRLVAGHR